MQARARELSRARLPVFQTGRTRGTVHHRGSRSYLATVEANYKMAQLSESQDDTKMEFNDYGIPLEIVPRLSCTDPEADRLIANMMPAVLTDTNLVASALKWDLDYLCEHMGSGDCTVYESDSVVFKYYDDAKVKEHRLKNFTPPTRRLEMKIGQFAEQLRNGGRTKYYLQQSLNETVGRNMVLDFLSFNWQWVNRQQKQNAWGPLTSNLLLVATEGNITPVHYDEQQNFFAQLRGYKRFLLFSPDQYRCLYPHPVWHPHDRQSQVDLANRDLDRFPLSAQLSGWEAIVGPGDVLYLPMYWWHQVESAPLNGYTVSINFWYKGDDGDDPLLGNHRIVSGNRCAVRDLLLGVYNDCGQGVAPTTAPADKVIYPLVGHQKMAIMRNIEKMLIEALKDVNEVGPLLRAMVLGRYT